MKRNHNCDLEVLMECAEYLARRKADGHLTIFRFTTGWKSALGTPDLTSFDGRRQVMALPAFPTLEAALEHVVEAQPILDSILDV